MSKASFIKRSLRLSYFSSITSTTLVLFILGLLGILLYDAVKLSHYMRENVGFTVVINEQANPVEIDSFRMKMSTFPYVKGIKVITKDMAEQEMKQALGEDFVQFLGYNPLPVTFDVQFNYEFSDPDQLKKIDRELRLNPIVKDIVYPTTLVKTIHSNLTRIAGGLALLFSLMLLVSLLLINGAIRLEMYSNRYTLMVMQRVGASNGFIRKPYMKRAWLQGAMAGLAASVALVLSYLGLYTQMGAELSIFLNINELTILCALLIGLGMLIVSLSTWVSVTNVINAKLEKHELFAEHS